MSGPAIPLSSDYAEAREHVPQPDWGANMNAKIAETAASAIRGILVNDLGQCESPLEELFLIALSGTYHLVLGNDGHDVRAAFNAADRIGQDPLRSSTIGKWMVWVQPKIGPYRVDFLLMTGSEESSFLWIVVECDGHDYHERTKDQARRDRSRDRDLQARGFRVLRFTGSELYANPFECVEQLEGFAQAEFDRR